MTRKKPADLTPFKNPAKLAPALDEWEELNTQHTRLSHAQALIDAGQSALAALDGDESARMGSLSGALVLLSQAISNLQDQAHVEPEFPR